MSFKHDKIIITSNNEVNPPASAYIIVTPGQTYSITIGGVGASNWQSPTNTTHIIITACGGGGGTK